MTAQTHPRSLDQRLFSELKTHRDGFSLSLVLQALLGGVILLQALLLSQTIARVFLSSEGLTQVQPLLIALLTLLVLRGLLVYGITLTAAEIAIKIKHALRQTFITHLSQLGPAFLSDERSGDLILSATQGLEKLEGYYRDYLPAVFTALFLPLLILLVVLPLDGLTFAVFLITAPLIPFFMALIGMAAGRLANQQLAEMRQLGAHFLDVMQGLTTLKLFNRSQHQSHTIGRMTHEFREATMRVLRVAFLSAFTLELLATLSVAVVAVEIGVRLLHGGIKFDQGLFLLIIAPEFYLPLRALGIKFHNATEGKAAAARLYEVLDMPLPLLSDSIRQVNSTHETKNTRSAPTLRFEDVCLSYNDGARQALNHVSFELRAGQHMAVVGASGSGKTSLASLLLRFLPPTSGSITVNGVDLTHLSAERWREQVAWVSQKPHLFNISIAENIRFGRPTASDTEMIAAAQAAGAHEFIIQLPQGYATLCGEHGLRLSGGQAQRVAIARALLRDAPLLILDEPTSQLDPDSEALVMAALHRLTQERTVLLITHRLSTAVYAETVILMDEGQIREQGRPETMADLEAHFAPSQKRGTLI